MTCSTDWSQVYFGVSTLLDASSSDGLKAEEEQKEVGNFITRITIFLKTDMLQNLGVSKCV